MQKSFFRNKITNTTRAFTLIEMAIVIVIIGLILGGVIAARTIINTTQIIAIANEVDQYRSAIEIFKDKYKSKPGDMSDAYDYFGTDCGTDSTSTSSGCNGNDDGLLGFSNGERLKAWKHLRLANLIEGNYTGVAINGTRYGQIDVNVPGSVITNVGYMFDYSIPSPERNFLVQKDYLLLGADDTTGKLENPSVNPVFAKAVDEKIDDGFAYTGLVVSLDADGHTGCITNPSVATGIYNLTTEDTVCIMNFYFYDITD